jgi:hypothetical protein
MKTNIQGKTYSQVLDELQTFVDNSDYIEEIYVSIPPTEENFATEVKGGKAIIFFADLTPEEMKEHPKIWTETRKCRELFRNFFAPEPELPLWIPDDEEEEECYIPNYTIEEYPKRFIQYQLFAPILFISRKKWHKPTAKS